MTDIFLSYSRGDQAIARRFATGFEAAGLSVWWDQALAPGEAFDKVTEKALEESIVVVVLWSKRSVDSRWVRAEATQALSANKLAPVMIEPCKRPIMFELTQTAELAHWEGDANDAAWLAFVNGLRRFVQRDLGVVADNAAASPAVTPSASIQAASIQTAPPQSAPPIAVKLAKQSKVDSVSSGGVRSAVSRAKSWLQTTAVVVMVAALASAAVYYRMLPAPEPINRFVHQVPAATPFRNTGRNVFALAPNGRSFVYNTSAGIYLRNMGELEARVIVGTEATTIGPFFSPDSQYLGYNTSTDDLKRIAVSGGAAVVITALPGNLNGASWSDDGNIYYAANGGIYRVSANGGTPELLVELAGSTAQTPQLLPDGDTLLYTQGPPPSRIMVYSLGSGESKELFSGARDARFVDGGYIVYGIDPGDGLFALRFDLATLTVSGSPVPLVQGVQDSNSTASVNYGIAQDGTLAYLVNPNPGSAEGGGTNSLALVDRDGTERVLDLPLRNYSFVRVSPDGKRIVVSIEDDLWVTDVDRPRLSRITTTDRSEAFPMWTPDSQAIVFADMAERALIRIAADGTGVEEQLAQIDPGSNNTVSLVSPGDWVGEDDAMTFTYGNSSDPKIGLLALTRANNDMPVWQPLIERAAGASGSAMAPGAEWIAYHADDTGDYGVYIERFPGLGTRQLVSDAAGGWGAYWSADGTELFYRRLGDGAMMAVSIQTTPTLEIGTPRVLFENASYMPASTPSEGGGSAKPWALAPDGRFLMIKLGGSVGDGADIVVVQHWTDELARLLP